MQGVSVDIADLAGGLMQRVVAAHAFEVDSLFTPEQRAAFEDSMQLAGAGMLDEQAVVAWQLGRQGCVGSRRQRNYAVLRDAWAGVPPVSRDTETCV